MKNGAELEKAPFSRSLVNCERNVAGFQKNGGTKPMCRSKGKKEQVGWEQLKGQMKGVLGECRRESWG